VQTYDPWPRYKEATKGFALLYQAITRDLRIFADGLDSPEETRWFFGIIAEFDAAFKDWEYSPRLRLALEEIDRKRSRMFEIVAYAYIHIAYDLPRCLAIWLSPPLRPYGQTARDAYLRAGKVLCDAFDRSCLDPEIFGFGAYAFMLWKRLPIVKAFSFGEWALRRRERSLEIATQLTVSTDRRADEPLIWREVERNLQLAAEYKNPFRWLEKLAPVSLPNPQGRPDVLDVVNFASDVSVIYSDEPIDDEVSEDHAGGGGFDEGADDEWSI
jgi:hypothetical protein